MNYTIDNSNLSNIKIVATSNIEVGTTIGQWVTKEAQSENSRYLWQKENMTEIWHESDDLGRYANHSDTPNVDVHLVEDSLILTSNKNIIEGEEIVVNYKVLPSLIGYIPNTSF